MTLEHLERKLVKSDKDLADLAKNIRIGRGEDVPLPEHRGMTMQYLIDYFRGSENVLDRKLVPIVEGMLTRRKGRDIRLPVFESASAKKERIERERAELIESTRIIAANFDDDLPIHTLFSISSSDQEGSNEWLEYYENLPLDKKRIITQSFNVSANEIRNRNRKLFGHALDTKHSVILVSDFRNLGNLIETNEIPDNKFTNFTAQVFTRIILPE